MSITGDDVRAARDTLGWTRPKLAEAVGVTVAQLARIELKGPRPEEEGLFTDVLGAAGVTPDEPEPEGEVLQPPPPPTPVTTADSGEDDEPDFELPDPPTSEPGADDFDTGRIVRLEYRGIKRGQVVRIDGEVGKRFRFGYHLKSPTQEFVSVYSTKNGGERSVRPERLRDQRGRVPVGGS